MALTLDQQLESLRTIILNATVHFAVWETIQEERDREKSVKAMYRFHSFFMPTIQAHLIALIAWSYQLLDTGRDVVSFRTLSAALLKANQFDVNSESEMSQLLDLMKPVWFKIRVIRHQWVAHSGMQLGQPDVFKSAGLSPREIADYLETARRLFNMIKSKLRHEPEAFHMEQEAREDTRSLMGTIVDA